ncbi:lectin-like domain-containing protein [Hymenobacter koreensis]|uniref:T9SS type A sorting domain-containing protein n=1 Tax=Hymenobacter koreensis TaxID=1084523 RepID=A0ABP8JJ09_9BACT
MNQLTTLSSRVTRLSWVRKSALAVAAAASCASALAQTTPAFPRNETFRNRTASNFSFGGAARLTGIGGTGNDAVGQGYLRLTDALPDQAGYTIDNVGFPSGAGFTISFEFFSYGKTTTDGADGFSLFLVDANQPSSGFRIGASGGSLGYAQKTVVPMSDGVSRGYIGIGIDEFGNFSNAREGRTGSSATLDATGRVPNAIAIRGAGNGSSATDYPYLTGTQPGDLDFSLDVPTARAQPGSTDYRRAFIDVVPTRTGALTTYRITVRIQHGALVKTAISNFTVPTPPQNLRLGFAGSTGGSTNVHEIRNLNIVQVPFANDDLASTNYNAAVTLNVLSNDVAPGSSIDLGSVDLDPNTAGRQTAITVPGQGEFTVNNRGLVVFRPAGTFAGTVTVPYTIQSILGADYTSSPANIQISVQGADVAAAVTGPAQASAGSQVTYTMTTSNRGTVPALNVVPRLQLPQNLPAGSVSGGNYNPSTGVVSFPPINSIGSNAPATVNTVTFRAPGVSTLTIVATASGSVPDPQLSNNEASVTTAIRPPLPVELSRFVVTAQGADALLSWATAQEKNNDHFDVERSLNGRSFEKIAAVTGQGTTASPTEYRLRDAGAARLGYSTVYYRLRQVDFDGQSEYSGIRAVHFGEQPAVALSIYPNPAQGRATLDLTALPAGAYTVLISDLTGRVLQERTLTGAAQHPVEADNLPAGTYLVQVRGAAGFSRTLPFVSHP